MPTRRRTHPPPLTLDLLRQWNAREAARLAAAKVQNCRIEAVFNDIDLTTTRGQNALESARTANRLFEVALAKGDVAEAMRLVREQRAAQDEQAIQYARARALVIQGLAIKAEDVKAAAEQSHELNVKRQRTEASAGLIEFRTKPRRPSGPEGA